LLRIHDLLAELHEISITLERLASMRWQDIGLESLSLIELVLHLEQEYGCTVSNEALREVRTLQDVATLVQAGCEPQ
jgi:acyl carrier protein